MTHICFVSPHSYSLFNPQYPFFFGGAELRAWIIGNELSTLPSYQISFIVLDHGQKKEEMFQNVKVISHSYHRGPPIFQNNKNKVFYFFAQFNKYIKKIYYFIIRGRSNFRLKHDETKLNDYYICPESWRVYSQINANIYCIFGNTNLSYELAMFCKANKKKFILFSASDIDFSEKYQIGSKEIDRYGSSCSLCYYPIEIADLIVCQTDYQRKILFERFKKIGIVIPNPISFKKYVNIPSNRSYALWIGKSDSTKQPLILLDIARAYPNIPFYLIMHKSDPNIHEKVYECKPINVTIIEYVPNTEIEHYFAKSFVFINTSQFEGFPNTFLQAGKYSVPILSLQVDPDNFIERYNCGIVADGDMSKLIKGLEIIINDNWQNYSHNIKKYVLANHNLDDQVRKLMSAFENI